MIHFLSIQNTYDSIEIALFKDEQLVTKAEENKIRASQRITQLLTTILQNNNLSLSDLSFLGVNQGPGPFTTLSVVIAS